MEWKIAVRAFILFLALLGAVDPVCSAKEWKDVQVLVDKNFRGDESQVLGIMDALTASGMPAAKFTVSTYDDFRPSRDRITTFLVSGSTGISFLKKMDTSLKHGSEVIWSGHQVFSDLEEVVHLTNLVILPKALFLS